MPVITFSRCFQKKHPREGEPTFFFEKIWKCLYDTTDFYGFSQIESKYNAAFPIQGIAEENIHMHVPKHHTIRSGNRWKVGDKFSPRVWGTDINPKSGRSGAYQSKQIIIAPDITIVKIWKFEYNGVHFLLDGVEQSHANLEVIARNDGLDVNDFYAWFPKVFTGQLISWSNQINY